jgi:sigma-B regulation protein RsbU (phosphoserine phosphatase)
MPKWLVRTAIVTYGLLALAFQIRLSINSLVKESEEPERARRPFAMRLFDPDGRIDFVFPDFRGAGLAKGDRILAIDGQPFTGAGTYYRALDSHMGGETMLLRIRRDSEQAERDVPVRLRSIVAEGGNWGVQDLIFLGVSQIFTPLTALALGLMVIIRRPEETLARLVFAFLLSFSILATGGLSYDPIRSVCQWEPGLRVLALWHMATWFYLWPVLLFLFAVYFPQRAEWDIRRPWLARLILAPAVANALLRGVAFPASIDALPTFRGLVAFTDALLAPRNFVYVAVLCIIATFAESIRKLVAASDRDTIRRLRILLVGSAVAWSPFLIAVFAQDLFGIRARGWFFIGSITLLVFFPITLAYLILVDRAMDIGVTIREGLQYAVARRGLYFVQFLVVLALVVGIGVSLGEEGLSLPRRIQRVGFGIAAAMISRRFVEKAGQWLDRRFFREQYQAGQLLTELAQQAGETADRTRLRELVTGRIATTLHTSHVHLIDDSTSEFAGTLSRLSQARAPQSIDWRRPPEWVTRLDAAEATRLLDLHAELLMPVARQSRLLGFLALGPRRSEQPYSQSDVAVLESVASQTAMALDNARLAETVAREAASREILDHELQIAREVQERLLPRAAPSIPGLDVVGLCVPAREVGGDLFDYLALPGGQWAIAVGDVAGKGVSAALIMAGLQASVRGLSADGIADLPELMTRLNRLTYDSTPSNRFATFQLGVFDPSSRAMRLCSAGHNPALHVGRNGELRWLRPRGVGLGLTRQTRYEQMEVALAPGDLMVFYTDGVTEAMNGSRELFGEGRLAAWARSAGDLPAMDLARDLAAQVAAFAGAEPQHDDITIIVVIAGSGSVQP